MRREHQSSQLKGHFPYIDTHLHRQFIGGSRLSWSVRHEDVAFRLGGDEFVLVLVGVDRAGAEYVLDRLRQRWAEVGTPVGFSAGIATGEGQDLMRVADQHMYANKRSRDLPAD